MPAPNPKDRGGAAKAPPSVIAAPPSAAPVEPVSPVVAAEPASPEPVFEEPVAEAPPNVEPQPSGYVAVFPIITANGRVEPGQPYQPLNDAERDLFLSQRVIRPA